MPHLIDRFPRRFQNPPTFLGAGSKCLIFLALPFLFFACGGGEAIRPEPSVPLVEAVEARAGRLPLEEKVNGMVRAKNQVAIRPEVAATVVEVLARSGESVERGEPLVRLESEELRERLRQAEADVRLAEAAFAEARARVAEIEARVRRTRALAGEDLVSEQDLEVQEAQLGALQANADQAAARVDQAAATAAERRSALTKTVVRAPVTGQLGQRQAEVGMRVDPGTVLFVMGSLDEMMVEVPLTDGMLGHVEAGMPVVVVPQGAEGEPMRAELSRVSPFLAEESFTTVGEIDIDNAAGRLRPGMFVSVRILYGESAAATLVPTSALWEEPESGGRGLFVVEEAEGLTAAATASSASRETSETVRRVTFRPVSILAEGGGRVGVEGVREGEWVVTVGHHLLWQQAGDDAAEEAAEGDDGSSAVKRGTTTARARVRPTSWERVEGLQNLQREDLLAGFLEKQQRISAALGSAIPASEDEVDRVLAVDDGAAPGGGDD